MAGNKNSGRKASFKNTNDKNLDRRGRAQRAQENNSEFQPIGPAPEELSEFGKSLWGRVVGQLANRKYLTVLDEPLLMEYVEQVEMSKYAQAEIWANGLTYTDDNGVIKKNPAVDIKNNAAKNIKSIGSSLGLDPISRSNLLAEEPTESEGNGKNVVGMFG